MDFRSSADLNKIGTQSQPRDARSTGSSVITQLTASTRRVAETNGKASYSDRVSLSDTAVDLNSLESRIKQLPDIDAARMVELHSRIMAGEYEIDAESVASKMLDLEMSL